MLAGRATHAACTFGWSVSDATITHPFFPLLFAFGAPGSKESLGAHPAQVCCQKRLLTVNAICV